MFELMSYRKFRVKIYKLASQDFYQSSRKYHEEEKQRVKQPTIGGKAKG